MTTKVIKINRQVKKICRHVVTGDYESAPIEVIRRKYTGMLSDGVIILHDSTRSYTAHKTKKLLQKFKGNVTAIQPIFCTRDYFISRN